MQARQLPARHGALWFFAGFHLFRRNPPLLTALTFAYLFIVIFTNLVPLIGPLLAPLLLPLLTLIVANACRAVAQGLGAGKLPLLHGIAAHRDGLLLLGGLQLAGSLAVLGINILLDGGAQDMAVLTDADPTEVLAMLARLLIIAAPVLMAFWFAPLLTGWDGVPAGKAVFFSLIATLRNWRAFSVYCLTVAMFAIAIPGLILVVAGAISPVLFEVFSVTLRMLLLFVIAPVLMASVYLSYRDIFHTDEHA